MIDTERIHNANKVNLNLLLNKNLKEIQCIYVYERNLLTKEVSTTKPKIYNRLWHLKLCLLLLKRLFFIQKNGINLPSSP